jgi:hypothetical protein
MKESEKSASELFEAHGDSAMIFEKHPTRCLSL